MQEAQVKRAVFHWYTGPINVLRDFVSQGHLASATLAAEYHEEHRRAIKETPFGNLMLETDSPVVYRASTGDGHKSEPADIVRVLQAVAKLKGVEPVAVAQRTTANARKFFGLSYPGIVS